MGHERLGLLPKSQKWRDIVAKIQSFSGDGNDIPDLVSATAEAIQSRFRSLCLDEPVQEAFSFLVALTIASRAEHPQNVLAEMGFALPGDPTPFNIARFLHDRLKATPGSPEYAEIARASAVEAIAIFHERESRQGDLFSTGTAFEVWRRASDGAGFCELSRQFFASLTKSYLEYFLEREASAVLPTLNAREQFGQNLNTYVEEISHHSFETAKIAQSFAAGWYNKHAQAEVPSRRQIKSFLRVAFNKIRDSLANEEVA